MKFGTLQVQVQNLISKYSIVRYFSFSKRFVCGFVFVWVFFSGFSWATFSVVWPVTQLYNLSL